MNKSVFRFFIQRHVSFTLKVWPEVLLKTASHLSPTKCEAVELAPLQTQTPWRQEDSASTTHMRTYKMLLNNKTSLTSRALAEF